MPVMDWIPRHEDAVRIGLICEIKRFLQAPDLESDLDSELLSTFEVDELLSGLRDAGHDVLMIGDSRHLLNRVGYWRNRCDLIFNKSVGRTGIDRKVHAAAILEVAGIPYVGSGCYSLALTRHKQHAKAIVERSGLHTPLCCLVPPASDTELRALPYPVIIKPVGESSSIGITREHSIVEDPRQAMRVAHELAARYHQPSIVESFVRGAEVEVPLLLDPHPRVLGVVGLSLRGIPVEDEAFLASDSVYGDDYGFAAPPSYVDLGRVRAAAATAATALGIRDYGRIDFRVDRDGTPWFIEASTHPHLQRHSSFFVVAQARELSYAGMLDELIGVACRRLGLA